MNFQQRPKAKTSLTYDASLIIPTILISEVALNKMYVYVDECKDEIGWLGTATHDEESNIYSIHDVYLFKQQVHGATTEITPQGLEEFAVELLAQENGMDIWNNMRMWGHSHVNMGVTPSGQDDKQMKEFSAIGQEWFIRLICNKKGEMKLDLHHYAKGLYFTDVAWEILEDEEENETANNLRADMAQLEHYYKSKMAELEGALDLESKAKVLAIKDAIVEEMDEKVSKIVYATKTVHVNFNDKYKDEPLVTTYGRNTGYGWNSWERLAPSQREMLIYSEFIPDEIREKFLEDKKNLGSNDDGKNGTEENVTEIENKQAVYDILDESELRALSFCRNMDEMEVELEELGYVGLAWEDRKLIWDVVKAEQLHSDHWSLY